MDSLPRTSGQDQGLVLSNQVVELLLVSVLTTEMRAQALITFFLEPCNSPHDCLYPSDRLEHIDGMRTHRKGTACGEDADVSRET